MALIRASGAWIVSYRVNHGIILHLWTSNNSLARIGIVFPSQKALRIDVDFELDRAASLWRLGEHAAQIGGKVVIARRFEQ